MRGQAHTLEAFTAALIVTTSVLFALQITAVTPLTASTASQHIENQQQAVANGVLTSAAENGTLKPTLLYWDEQNGTFHDSDKEEYYTDGGPPTALGARLDETFRDRGIAFNLEVRYVDEDGDRDELQIVNFGEPSDHAVVAARTVALYDDDPLYDDAEQPTGTTLADASGFYAPNRGDGHVYNVLEVKLTVWRM